MGQKEKLIRRLKERPRDFTFEEAETLLGYLEFIRSNKGRTSGSRVMFSSPEHGTILLHKPHPQRAEGLSSQAAGRFFWNRRA